MRALLAALTFCLLVSTASAHGRYHHHVHPMVRSLGSGLVHMLDTKGHRHGNHLRHYAGLSGPCVQAARQGGPCGCYASILFFGHSVPGLWRAMAWLEKFPRVPGPIPGVTAAVWGNGHHVAKVDGVAGDKVVVNDSWNHAHVVSSRGLRFVKV